MNKHECQNQLDWSAFCYVSGDMSAAEAQEFELRLSGEQSAREALARAVELTQVVAAAESQCGDPVTPAGRPTSSWTARLAWMAIGGLASLLIAGLWSSAYWVPDEVAESPETIRAHRALASAWYETRRELFGATELGPLHPISAAVAEPGEELFAVVEDAQDEPLLVETPSWMAAAVAGLADEMEEDPEDPNQT
jgi:hypothetical protein